MKRLWPALWLSLVVVLVAAAVVTSLARPAEACGGGTVFLGQICTFAFDFCPRGFAPPNGQLLPIPQNVALFSLLGTYYGGDGIHTFALPDLRGRAIVGTGQGLGINNVDLGDTGGGDQTVTVAVGTRGPEAVAMQLPFLGLTFCLATEGIYPPRP